MGSPTSTSHHVTQGKLSDPGSTCCTRQRHSRSVDDTPDRLRRQQPTTPHECQARMDSGHHVHRTALAIHTSYSTRTADTPLPLSHSRSLTLWHLTLASILVRPSTSCKLYSAEVLLSTGGTAMRSRALSVLRARQLIVEQLIVRRELS